MEDMLDMAVMLPIWKDVVGAMARMYVEIEGGKKSSRKLRFVAFYTRWEVGNLWWRH